MFDFCVHLLMELAHLVGMTYAEVNVLIFCVFLPAVLGGLLAENAKLTIEANGPTDWALIRFVITTALIGALGLLMAVSTFSVIT